MWRVGWASGAEPLVQAAIEMQQLAEAGARLAPPMVAAARAGSAHEPGFLQRQLPEAVLEPHAMVAPGEAIAVAYVLAGKPLAVQAQDGPLHGGRDEDHRHLLG
jgi:hypothetical protein